jgi:hypothetical protein
MGMGEVRGDVDFLDDKVRILAQDVVAVFKAHRHMRSNLRNQ